LDNRAGAGGSIGIRAAAGARPDGQTLLYATAQHRHHPVASKGYDRYPHRTGADLPDDAYQYALMVNANLPVNSVAELVALARKEPGKLTYFSVGIGSATHLNSAWFTQAAGINVTHVPYKGFTNWALHGLGAQATLVGDVGDIDAGGLGEPRQS